MKFLLTLSFSVLLPFSVSAQSTFGKLFRSNLPFAINSASHATFLQTIDSALLLIYNVNDTAIGTDVYLQKLTNDGVVLWEKRIIIPFQMEKLVDAVQMPDSTINILCTYDIGNLIYDEEVLFVKIDLNGNLLGTHFQTGSGICCWDIGDGRLNLDLKSRLLTTHQSYGISFSNGIVSVLDTNYAYITGGNDNMVLYHADMFQDIDSSYLTFGHEPVTQQKRASLVKRNKNFTFQWQKYFRHPATATARLSVADDALQVDSNYVLLMHFEDTNAINNMYIVKTNMNGDSITSACFPGEGLPFGMYSLGNDGYIIAASNFTIANFANLELLHLDTALQIISRRQYRYNYLEEQCWSFKPAFDGTFLLAASADSFGYRNIHILKIKPDLCVDPTPAFTINYNTGLGNGLAGIIINNISDYGIYDPLNTSATIYFGDGDSADFYTDTIYHIYATQGTYTIALTITTPCGTQTFTRQVIVPCTGQPFAFATSVHLLDLNVDYNHVASFYNWSFGDGGTANTQFASHTYAVPGTYNVCLHTTNSCGVIQLCDSVTVVCSAPVIPFSSSVQACAGSIVNIDAGNAGSQFIWSDGQTTQIASFGSTGIYTVTVTNNCGVSSIASVAIQFSAIPQIALGNDTIICINDQLLLTNLFTGNNYAYQWFDNYQIVSNGNQYTFFSINSGLFHISLIADNNGCIDSTFLNITVSPPLICDTGSYCIPTYTTGTAQGDYIKRVSLGTISNITGGTGQPAYMDYTHLVTSLNAGQSFNLTLEFNEVNPMYYKIWMDYNQDGMFSNFEAVTSGAVNPGITMISTGLSLNAYGGPTRMRVRCVNSSNSNIDPCGSYTFGQTEDYTILIQNGLGAPIAAFSADTTHIYINGMVNFTDLSYNNPTGWEWTFTGANAVTSVSQNPAGIIYPTPGCFPVVLKVFNAHGFNFKLDTCYINVDLTLSLPKNTFSGNFSIQPNPFNNRFKLNYYTDVNSTLIVYDIAGRTIMEFELDKNRVSNEIDLSKFEEGVYYLNIKSKQGVLYNTPLLKMK